MSELWRRDAHIVLAFATVSIAASNSGTLFNAFAIFPEKAVTVDCRHLGFVDAHTADLLRHASIEATNHGFECP